LTQKILLTVHTDQTVIGGVPPVYNRRDELPRFMRSHSRFEGLSLPPPKTRSRSSRAKLAPRPRPESPLSVSEPKIEAFAPANRARSELTTVEKAGATAQGVAKGLAIGLGAELAIGFAVGATGVAASTIIWMFLPIPIYAIATRWTRLPRGQAGSAQARGRRMTIRWLESWSAGFS